MTPDERVRSEERALAARPGDAAGWLRLSRDHERLGRADDAARAALMAHRAGGGHLERLAELGWHDGLWPAERGDPSNRRVSPLPGPDEGVLCWKAALPRPAWGGRPLLDLEGRVLTRAEHGGVLRVSTDGRAVEVLPGPESYPVALRRGAPVLFDGSQDAVVTPRFRHEGGWPVARALDGGCYAYTSAGVIAFAADGEVRWRAPFSVTLDVAASPGRVLQVVGRGDTGVWVRALDAASGELLAEGPPSPRQDDGPLKGWVIARPDGGWLQSVPGVMSLHEPDGRQRWRMKPEHRQEPAALVGDRLVVTSGLSVEELEVETGRRRWRRELRSGESPLLDGRGIVYVVTLDGRLVGVRPDGATHLQAHFKAPGYPGAPVIGWDRTAYVTVGRALFAIR